MNEKQKRFVAEYLVDLNATQAAIRAGYSPRTARKQASDLLTKPDIAAAVAAGQKRRINKLELSAERVLKEMSRLAFSDVTRLYALEGQSIKALDDLSEDDRAAIAHIETVRRNLAGGDGHTDVIHKIRLWDKPKSLEMLGKHFALLTERVEVKGLEGLAARLAAGRERAAK